MSRFIHIPFSMVLGDNVRCVLRKLVSNSSKNAALSANQANSVICYVSWIRKLV